MTDLDLSAIRKRAETWPEDSIGISDLLEEVQSDVLKLANELERLYSERDENNVIAPKIIAELEYARSIIQSKNDAHEACKRENELLHKKLDLWLENAAVIYQNASKPLVIGVDYGSGTDECYQAVCRLLEDGTYKITEIQKVEIEQEKDGER